MWKIGPRYRYDRSGVYMYNGSIIHVPHIYHEEQPAACGRVSGARVWTSSFRQQAHVPLTDGGTDAGGGRLAKQPWLAAGGLEVRVAAEEGVEGADLQGEGAGGNEGSGGGWVATAENPLRRATTPTLELVGGVPPSCFSPSLVYSPILTST